MDQRRYLMVGLGNPGREHARNRHNAGFMLIDALARNRKVSRWRLRCESMVAQADSGRLVLAKPQTYMNESGRAVACLLRELGLPLEHLLVAFDDLDLPTGELRLRPAGGSSGQRGMASIIERLSGNQFPRLRVGIGRPPGSMDPADYVLEDFAPAEQEQMQVAFAHGVDCLRAVVERGLEEAMTRCNTGAA